MNDGDGYIDLLWKGMLLVEMKTTGKDLEKAYTQAKDYCAGLKDYELPKLILISDFQSFHLYDEEGKKSIFALPELTKNVQAFGHIAGYEKRTYKEQDPVNIRAAELMGKLHDKLKEIGYTGHRLEHYLVRLLFCLFADDTGIFDRGIMLDYLLLKTSEDGTDLAMHLDALFDVLNTPEEQRLKNIDESLTAFPYVNGKLFEERLPLASFDSDMRNILLRSCSLDWGKISPAIFGSLFQSVMDEKERRNLGAHYTSEKNILKLIKPLFLDELWDEFNKIRNDKNKLRKLHDKISKLRFLDPACGCGNFLIIAYRELRLLELEIVKKLLEKQTVTSINDYFLVDVDQFYGIEYEEFPSQIAQVAMWLIDHQMNEAASIQFGEYYKRIPLKKSANIINGNALRISWQTLIPNAKLPETVRYHYILGNPPFIGSRLMDESQKEDTKLIFNGVKGNGDLDYVACWYKLAVAYMQISPTTKTAFVSTNSITQGTQVGILWASLISSNIKINFAHKTFRWSNEAKGVAAVYVVIIGFSLIDNSNKILFVYENVGGNPEQIKVKNINPYLIEGNNTIILSRQKPICEVPEMNFGNMPADGGMFLFTEDEKKIFLNQEPAAKEFMKPLISAHEFLNGKTRWCLWLEDATPSQIKKLPAVYERVQNVRKIRLESSRPFLAEIPALFAQITQPPNKKVLAIPRHSSENRNIIPFGFFSSKYKIHDSCMCVADASLYHFGVLQSTMHMLWVRYTCGRIKSDYRYSKDVVYNNFPWPDCPTEKNKKNVEAAAQAVLNAREQFPDSTLSQLYDPSIMPLTLAKAHHQLDKAIDLCYRSQPFPDENRRIEFLFDLYDTYTAGLFAKEKKLKNRLKKK